MLAGFMGNVSRGWGLCWQGLWVLLAGGGGCCSKDLGVIVSRG